MNFDIFRLKVFVLFSCFPCIHALSLLFRLLYCTVFCTLLFKKQKILRSSEFFAGKVLESVTWGVFTGRRFQHNYCCHRSVGFNISAYRCFIWNFVVRGYSQIFWEYQCTKDGQAGGLLYARCRLIRFCWRRASVVRRSVWLADFS